METITVENLIQKEIKDTAELIELGKWFRTYGIEVMLQAHIIVNVNERPPSEVFKAVTNLAMGQLPAKYRHSIRLRS